ncbi:hypothetical protein NDU88_006234 [Pleurodeles waltl]|uniref:Uncharacterized protein n=1 Tax=Pleurodeles waltl TaxID=8319 RepID=A0AAV7RPP5_PLEWA|nr:hypothetical protein NDU88_006234 [Pleurodeles waltl]
MCLDLLAPVCTSPLEPPSQGVLEGKGVKEERGEPPHLPSALSITSDPPTPHHKCVSSCRVGVGGGSHQRPPIKPPCPPQHDLTGEILGCAPGTYRLVALCVPASGPVAPDAHTAFSPGPGWTRTEAVGRVASLLSRGARLVIPGPSSSTPNQPHPQGRAGFTSWAQGTFSALPPLPQPWQRYHYAVVPSWGPTDTMANVEKGKGDWSPHRPGGPISDSRAASSASGLGTFPCWRRLRPVAMPEASQEAATSPPRLLLP